VRPRKWRKGLNLRRLFRVQKKHQALLGTYEPVIVRTTLRVRPEPIWTRIRVELDPSSRGIAVLTTGSGWRTLPCPAKLRHLIPPPELTKAG
jgi:hypothetical protein